MGAMRVEAADGLIKQLAGLPCNGIGRVADLVWCGSGTWCRGVTIKGRLVEQPEFALHIQCHSRITLGEKLLIATLDLYEPADDDDPGKPPLPERRSSMTGLLRSTLAICLPKWSGQAARARRH